MKTPLIKLKKLIPLLILLMAVLPLNAQQRYAPIALSDFNLTLGNDVQTASNILEFDVNLLDTDASGAFELATVQAGIVVNPSIYNGGTVTISIVPGTSQLVAAQQPTSVVWSQAQNTIKLTPRTPPGAGSGTIISTVAPGTRVCRLRITNTVAFTAGSQANLTFNFTTSPYPTKVFQYVGGVNTQLVTDASNCFSNLANIILNPAASAPTAFEVTGSGAYCQGTGGLPVGLAYSEVGVTYTLFKDAVAQAPTVAGTGSAFSFGNQLAGTYTVSGTNGGGTTAMTGSAVITENVTINASVTINVSANNVSTGTQVTFTATPVGGGATPLYQWYKNSVATGTGNTYSYIPLNGDVVYVVMTSSSVCATGSPAASNSITMVVNTTTSEFNMTLANDVQTAPNIMEFDVFLLNPDPASPFELAIVQAGILVDPNIYNGGNISLSIVPGSSQLVAAQQPSSVIWSQAQNTIKLTPKTPPGAGSGTILSTTAPGTRVCRLRITNSVPFTSDSYANLLFNFTTTPYPTKVFQYIAGVNTELTCTTLNCFSNAANIVLNPSTSAPASYAIIGGGAYCQGSGGLPVGLANSEAGVTYTLFKDAVAQTPTVAGTGAAITFGNQLAGTYTVSGTNGLGTTPMSGTAVITENPIVTASVSVISSSNNVCEGTTVTFTTSASGGGTNPAYQWYKNGIAISTGETYTYIPQNGDVIYVVMTSNAPCVAGNPATSNSITMIVNPSVTPGVTIMVDQNNVCAGTSVTFTTNPLGGGTAPTFQWYKNGIVVSTGATYTDVLENGDMVYTVMTSNAPCVTTGGTSTSNTITMIVNSLPAAAGIISGPTAVCAGTMQVEYSVDAITGANSYIWVIPAGATIVSGTGTNSITVDFGFTSLSGNVSVNGVNDCGSGTASLLMVTVNTKPATPVITLNANILTSDAPLGNQWYRDGVMIPGANAQTYTIPEDGTYTVLVTLNGCSSEQSNSIVVLHTGQAEHEAQKVNVYPNPTTGEFWLSINSKGTTFYEMKVLNGFGAVVYKADKLEVNGTFKQFFNLKGLSAGMYTLILNSNNQQITKKIVIN